MMAVDLTRTARALCWIASALLLAAYACVFARYAVDFPRVDDYSQLLAVPYYVSLEPTAADALAYLLSLSVEHRIATLRLAALAQARYLGGLDFIALMALGAVVLAVGVAIVVMQAPRAHRAWVALVAVALFVSPVHYEAQYWATGALQHEGVLGLALVALWLVARHNPVGIAVACLAALTSANGLMTFAAAAVLLWHSRRRRLALAMIVVTAVAFTVYFAGYDKAGAPTLPALWPAVRFAAIAAGSLCVDSVPSAALGTALFALWIFPLRKRASPFLVASAFFLAATFAAMAVGRAGLGEEAAVLSRYRIYSAALTLVTVVAAIEVVAPRVRGVIAMVTTPAALAWLAWSVAATMPLVANTWFAQEISRATYLATGHGVYVPWPPQEYGDFMLERAGNLGYFKPQPSRYPLREPAPGGWHLLRCCESDAAP